MTSSSANPPHPAEPTSVPIYPAGPSYIAAARRRILKRTFAEDDAAVAAEHEHKQKTKAEEDGAELYPGLGEESEAASLLQMDAKEWKVRGVLR